MTDQTPATDVDDIVDEVDLKGERLDPAGDRRLADGEARNFARAQGLRRALRSDIETGRDWARERAFLARTRIEEQPLEASLYAFGLGVLIGILLRR